MSHKKMNRIVAGGVFLVSFVAYMATLSPTVVFWDVGEFCAASFSMQVPHPPGAPLFLLLARLASMVPFVSDVAVRMHFLSGFASALSCAFLYLLSVKFIVLWRGVPASTYDRILVYGSAVVGSLSLAFSPTFWFNAVEAEVYGMSMLFVSGIILLGMRWYERAENEGGDLYLLFIAYILGLAVGVHLLAILALFPVMLFYYFRYHEFSVASFLKFGIAALIVFGIVYPGIVKELPSLLDGEFGGTRSELFTAIPVVLICAAIFGVYYSIRKHNRLLNIALLSFLFIVLGYSTYATVYIRANAHPPMNENDPSTLARLVSYLNREQYGEAPLVDRRWNNEPEQRAAAAKYTSDLDYFLKYQLDHMYLRYFGWNYVGSEGDFKEAGVNWRQLYGIPLFLGLIGAFYHWRRDPKMAAVASAAFLVMGLALVIYFNMQEPQPRERDYFYVGSFFIFSMWIGMGVLALADWIKERYHEGVKHELLGYSILALAIVFVPANMLRTNYHQANRTGNYVAWDYSYNLLQTCDQDAILFTNGDNDTFPLWYLQDVEGVRRDVRVVCLSLLNTNWYVRQLKHAEPYGTKAVPIATSDAEIEHLGPREFQPRVVKLPVPGDVMRSYSVEGTASSLDTHPQGKGETDTISFYMPNTLQFGSVKAIRVQDFLVFDIIASTNWQRPIYFAMTVSPDGQIGLKDYLQMEGLAFRLVPKKGSSYISNLNEPKMREEFFKETKQFSKTPATGFLWRGLQDSTTYFDEDVRRLMTNYRQALLLLSQYYAAKGLTSKVTEPLDRMEQIVPRHVIPMDNRTKMFVANYYEVGGQHDKFHQICREIINDVKPLVDRGSAEALTYDNPYIILLQTYEALRQYDDALKLTDVIRTTYAREQGIDQITGQLRARLQAEKNATQGRDSLAGKGPLKGN
ncbi:MAG TPA: DUF2723 domain-containing protein [Bacteroidota bacterium]|nr:DUF2723 domain-containing protein [Bacteroidota bacterium]